MKRSKQTQHVAHRFTLCLSLCVSANLMAMKAEETKNTTGRRRSLSVDESTNPNQPSTGGKVRLANAGKSISHPAVHEAVTSHLEVPSKLLPRASSTKKIKDVWDKLRGKKEEDLSECKSAGGSVDSEPHFSVNLPLAESSAKHLRRKKEELFESKSVGELVESERHFQAPPELVQYSVKYLISSALEKNNKPRDEQMTVCEEAVQFCIELTEKQGEAIKRLEKVIGTQQTIIEDLQKEVRESRGKQQLRKIDEGKALSKKNSQKKEELDELLDELDEIIQKGKDHEKTPGNTPSTCTPTDTEYDQYAEHI